MKVKQDLTKLYYSIGEVSEMFDVSSSLLRYWESEFPRLKPQKNRKGDRRFTKKDIEEIERIYTLVKERGFTLEGAKKELRRQPKKDHSAEIAKRLHKLKKGLQSFKNKL